MKSFGAETGGANQLVSKPRRTPLLKTARQELDIINAYEETGSLRAAAALCGTTHKTVKRVLERREAGQRPGRRRVPVPGLADPFARIPSDWDVRPSKRGGGTVYSDPENRGRQIRIMPGYPPGSRPDPLAWGPYVEVSQNGVTTKVPLAGNPTLGSP
jgi:hypothetical protein